MQIVRSKERGFADHGWLKSFHTFSFAGYQNPARMGFRVLRVINEDRVAAGKGFGTHSHQEMEIISYVLSGALQHKDSMGNGAVMVPGDVQRMSAGTGVMHSEFNGSKSDQVHFLQIWIVPKFSGPPGYEQTHFPPAEKRGKLRVVASPDGREGSVTLRQDACLYAGLFDSEESAEHMLGSGRHAWVHLISGKLKVNGAELSAGDAAPVPGGPVRLTGGVAAEVLLFDLP